MKIHHFIFISLVFLWSCTSQKHRESSSSSFLNWEGVTLVDSIGVYQYKDTLYYVNEPSEFVFKIPEGFTVHRGSTWNVDGVHLINVDSTMVIELIALDRGIARNNYDGTLEDILSEVACDNADNRLYYNQTDSGYLKVGLSEDFKPFVEKAYDYSDEDDDMFNYHINIVRLCFPDSLAKQAARLNYNYIEPWPNNIYK